MLNEQSIRELLGRVAQREQSVDDAIAALKVLPFEDVGFAKLDHHREIRRGFPEVIYCQGKTPQQVAEICARQAMHSQRILGTRASIEQFEAARKSVGELRYDATARALWMDRRPEERGHEGIVLLAAGTSDLAVAEEAAMTLRLMGQAARRIYDVGVAGLQRILAQLPALREANVIIVVAGMEGALAGVVAGLVSSPVIAVPTSVGYGASFGGLAALLGMLNNCAGGMAVVNIDNGYGAAYMAALINQRIVGRANIG
jgi:NCAIR mutase (PurE)-related protein